MSASAAVGCLGQYEACALRVARLDATCAPLNSLGDIVVTAALMTMTATPDVTQGKRFEPETACGAIAWTAEAQDRVKRYNITAELAVWDYEFLEILTGAPLIIGDAGSTWPSKVVGIESPGPNSPDFNGASLEIFAKTSGAGGPCGPVSSNPPYVQHIFPRCKFTIADITFQNDVIVCKITGWSTNNSQWKYGPVTIDWNGDAPLGENAPYAQLYAETLPTVGCGIIATAS